MPRLLPWPTPEGKTCYLLTDDGDSRLSGLVGDLEAAQLTVGTDALGLARKVLADPGRRSPGSATHLGLSRAGRAAVETE